MSRAKRARGVVRQGGHHTNTRTGHDSSDDESRLHFGSSQSRAPPWAAQRSTEALPQSTAPRFAQAKSAPQSNSRFAPPPMSELLLSLMDDEDRAHFLRPRGHVAPFEAALMPAIAAATAHGRAPGATSNNLSNNWTNNPSASTIISVSWPLLGRSFTHFKIPEQLASAFSSAATASAGGRVRHAPGSRTAPGNDSASDAAEGSDEGSDTAFGRTATASAAPLRLEPASARAVSHALATATNRRVSGSSGARDAGASSEACSALAPLGSAPAGAASQARHLRGMPAALRARVATALSACPQPPPPVTQPLPQSRLLSQSGLIAGADAHPRRDVAGLGAAPRPPRARPTAAERRAAAAAVAEASAAALANAAAGDAGAAARVCFGRRTRVRVGADTWAPAVALSARLGLEPVEGPCEAHAPVRHVGARVLTGGDRSLLGGAAVRPLGWSLGRLAQTLANQQPHAGADGAAAGEAVGGGRFSEDTEVLGVTGGRAGLDRPSVGAFVPPGLPTQPGTGPGSAIGGQTLQAQLQPHSSPQSLWVGHQQGRRQEWPGQQWPRQQWPSADGAPALWSVYSQQAPAQAATGGAADAAAAAEAAASAAGTAAGDAAAAAAATAAGTAAASSMIEWCRWRASCSTLLRRRVQERLAASVSAAAAQPDGEVAALTAQWTQWERCMDGWMLDRFGASAADVYARELRRAAVNEAPHSAALAAPAASAAEASATAQAEPSLRSPATGIGASACSPADVTPQFGAPEAIPLQAAGLVARAAQRPSAPTRASGSDAAPIVTSSTPLQQHAAAAASSFLSQLARDLAVVPGSSAQRTQRAPQVVSLSDSDD